MYRNYQKIEQQPLPDGVNGDLIPQEFRNNLRLRRYLINVSIFSGVCLQNSNTSGQDICNSTHLISSLQLYSIADSIPLCQIGDHCIINPALKEGQGWSFVSEEDRIFKLLRKHELLASRRRHDDPEDGFPSGGNDGPGGDNDQFDA